MGCCSVASGFSLLVESDSDRTGRGVGGGRWVVVSGCLLMAGGMLTALLASRDVAVGNFHKFSK